MRLDTIAAGEPATKASEYGRLFWEVIAQAIRDLGGDLGQPSPQRNSPGWPPTKKFQDAARWLFVAGDDDINQPATFAWYCAALGLSPAMVRRRALDSLSGVNLAILEMMNEAGLLVPPAEEQPLAA